MSEAGEPTFQWPCPHPGRHGNHEIYRRHVGVEGEGVLFCMACGAEAVDKKPRAKRVVKGKPGSSWKHDKTGNTYRQPYVIDMSPDDWALIKEAALWVGGEKNKRRPLKALRDAKCVALNATNAQDGQVMVLYTRNDKLFVRERDEFTEKFTPRRGTRK